MCYETMLKTIFWEYNFSAEDIQYIVKNNDVEKKKFLFEKILLNSIHILNDLKIFEKDDLKYLIENFKVPKFNAAYIERRKNIVEYYFLDKPLTITELKWIA